MTDQKTHTHPLLSLTQKTDPSTLFSLLHPIGSGSYGEVWKALATTDVLSPSSNIPAIQSGQIVAMKIIKLEANEDMDDVLNEVLFLSECDHKNVVRYFGCWLKNIKPKRGKEVWIGMEYCGGGSVEGCYKGLKSPLPEPSIRIILFSALHGLRFLHSLNKMHRDIKCGNILLTESGEVKLADFGVSTQLTRTFSKRHTFIGTPYWMAPEVITADQMGEGGGGGGGGGTVKGGDAHANANGNAPPYAGYGYDYKADIWSLGISALELTDLSPPNFDLHPMRVLFTIPKSPPPTIQSPGWTINPTLSYNTASHTFIGGNENGGKTTDIVPWSEEFKDFLQCCLKKDPEKRWNADQLLEHAFFTSTPLHASGSTITSLIDRTREAKRLRQLQSPHNPLFPQSDSDSDDETADDSQTGTVRGTVKPSQADKLSGTVKAVPRLQTGAELEGTGSSPLTSSASTPKYGNTLTRDTQLSSSPTSPGFTTPTSTSRSASLSKASGAGTLKLLREVRQLQGIQDGGMSPISGSFVLPHGKDESMAILGREGSSSGSTMTAAAESPASSGASKEKKPQFKATRLCRLTLQILCAEYLSPTLLLGTANGLFSLPPTSSSLSTQLIPLSTRRYDQITALPHLNLIISRSGKYSMVSTHALTPHTNSFKKSKFETETKLKKIKETKGCSFYKVAEISGDVYLVIALPKSILILKYAHAPYNKFLKLKELGLDAHHETITSLDLMPHPNNATSLRLGIGMQEGFKVLDLQSLAVEDFGTPVDAGDVRGSEVFEEGVVFCFEHMGLLQPLSTSASIHAWTEKTLNWRHPLTFHGRLTPTHLISGSATTLDVISLPSGKIMHVFETKRDKIKGLHLLVCKEGRVFVMAEEERDGGAVGSVILIEVVD